MVLHKKLLRKLPPPLLYRAMAWKMRLIGEAEVRLLPRLVPRDKIALDIGANYGAYTFWLERLAKAVIAFEPQPRLHDFLRRVVSPHVSIAAVALSDRDGEADCAVPLESGMPVEGLASLRAGAFAACQTIKVQTRTLDGFGLSGVGFIKIDVEGFEAEVLAGARNLLQRERPVLLVEIEQRHLDRPMDETFALLAELGYRGCFWRSGTFVGVEAFDASRDQDMKNHTRLGLIRRRYINNFLFTAEPLPGAEATSKIKHIIINHLYDNENYSH